MLGADCFHFWMETAAGFCRLKVRNKKSVHIDSDLQKRLFLMFLFRMFFVFVLVFFHLGIAVAFPFMFRMDYRAYS